MRYVLDASVAVAAVRPSEPHHPAARAIDQDRGRLHQRQFARADQVMRLRRIGNHEHYKVGARQQFITRHIGGIEIFLLRFSQTLAVVVKQLHVEAARAPRNGLADAPHTDDAERGVMHVAAQHLL